MTHLGFTVYSKIDAPTHKIHVKNDSVTPESTLLFQAQINGMVQIRHTQKSENLISKSSSISWATDFSFLSKK